MPLDPRARRFLQLLAAGNPSNAAQVAVAERRAGLAALLELGGAGPPVGRVDERPVPGAQHALGARLYTPLDSTAATLPGLAYFHGGGHVAGSTATHDAIARELANAGRCRVASVDYRLAPEHRFPAALEDAQTATRYLASHAAEFGIDPARFGICGDSAGGTLAAAACQSMAGEGLLHLQVLICPILDYGGGTPSRREFASGYLVDESTLAHDLMHYLPPDVPASDARVSPLRAASLEGLPPTLIHTAEFDPMRDEGSQYFQRLSRTGCRVTYSCHAGMIHLFYGLKAMIPAAALAFAEIGAQIQAAFAREPCD